MWPGVDFIKVGSTAQIIEIALSICTLCLRPTKIWAYGAIGCKPVYEIDPWEISFFPYLDCPSSQTASYLVLARKSLLVRAYACNAKTWCRHMQLMCIVFGYYLYTLFQEIFVIVNLSDSFWHLGVHILTMSGLRNKL